MEIHNKITGVISDLHIPGHIHTALEFVRDTFSQYKVEQVVCVGDLIDHHFISRHISEVDAMSPKQEVRATRKELKRWVAAFPKMFLCRGNHDAIPARHIKQFGMDESIFLKSLNQIYGLPKAWVWDDWFTMNKELWIEHGIGSGGMYGAKNTAWKKGCSYVQGHTHSGAAVFNIPLAFKQAQAMNVGCMIDSEKYNARYGKIWFKTPVSLGCGIINDPNEMHFVPMR